MTKHLVARAHLSISHITLLPYGVMSNSRPFSAGFKQKVLHDHHTHSPLIPSPFALDHSFPTTAHTHTLILPSSSQVREGLQSDIADGDEVQLKLVMAHIRDVRRRMDATAAMWEPLHECIALLKKHK